MVRAYLPVALAALATAFSLLGDQMLYSVLPTYHESLGLTYIQVGLLLSANRWVRFVTNHVAERALARGSVTFLFALALAVGAAITAMYGTVTMFAALLMGRMLWGLCWSFIRQSGLMTAADVASPDNTGFVMGGYNFLSRLGSLTGNALGAIGHDMIGFGKTMWAFAGVSLLGIPLGIASQRGVDHGRRKHHTSPAPFRETLGLWGCGFVVGCVGSGLIMSTLGMVLKRRVGDSVIVAGVAIGVATLNGLLLSLRWAADWSAPLWGAVSDRLGRRRAALLYFGFGAFSLLVGTQTPATSGLVVAVIFFFLSGTAAHVTVGADAIHRGPRATASFVTAADMGSATGPIIGWMAPSLSLPTSAIFLIGGTLYAVGAVISQFSLSDKASS